MSYAPQRLQDLQEYMHDRTGLPFISLGIVGNLAHVRGYHLGHDRIFGPNGRGWDDYSVLTQRDLDGLSDAASAIDIGKFKRLVELTMWMVGQARAGNRPDTRAIIGPWNDGRAYRFDHLDNWVAQRRARGDSHETHIHESYYRDSESRDKIQFFRPFFEGIGGSGIMLPAHGDQGEVVKYWQRLLMAYDSNYLPEFGHDGDYGDETAEYMHKFHDDVGGSNPNYDGRQVTSWVAFKLHEAVYGAGARGPRGPEGPPGKTPKRVAFDIPRITGTVVEVE